MSDDLRDVIARKLHETMCCNEPLTMDCPEDAEWLTEADAVIAAIVAATKKDPRWLEEEGIIERPTDSYDGAHPYIVGDEENGYDLLWEGDVISPAWSPLYRLHGDPA